MSETPNSNFIKEEAPIPPSVTKTVLIQNMVLTQHNLLDACGDIAKFFTFMSRNNVPVQDVIQKVGAARVAITVAEDRLDRMLEQLKNPGSLTS